MDGGLMDLVEISRWLNRDGISAAPCEWLSAVSIFGHEHYENFDYDLIGPRDRLAIAGVLDGHGFKQRSGRSFEGPGGRIEFPRPPRLLSADPTAEFESTRADGADAVFATPTQVILATWRHEAPEPSRDRRDQLLALVREQPANLDKVGDWLRRSDGELPFGRFKPQLSAVQEEGYQLRRTGRFRSALPR
ncbi:MAG: hypothetical protein PVG92_01890 [Holophagae bacterium]